jgi:ribosomal protein L23
LQLEIKGFLEGIYGMKVEKVQTINYLGKRLSVITSKSKLVGYVLGY